MPNHLKTYLIAHPGKISSSTEGENRKTVDLNTFLLPNLFLKKIIIMSKTQRFSLPCSLSTIIVTLSSAKKCHFFVNMHEILNLVDLMTPYSVKKKVLYQNL